MDADALALAIAAAANDNRGQLMSGFVSKHAGSTPYNENNYGIGYRSPDGWMGGVYRNSLNKPSAYFGKEFTHDLLPNRLAAGLMVGGVTGYGRPVNPLLLPELIYKMDKERAIAMGLIPPVKGVTPATIALQLRRRF